MNNIVFKFPTTVLIIDDDLDFINILIDEYDSNEFSLKHIENHELISYLKQYESENQYPNVISNLYKQINSNWTFETQIKNFYKTIYNPRRFETISVILADYSMPHENGLDLVRKIKNKRIKKYILSGVMNHDLVLKSFNEKEIDAFSPKNDFAFHDTCYKNITFLQHEFFKDISNQIMTKNNQYDPILQNLLNIYISEENPCEIYPLNTSGSMLFLTETGKISGLFCYTAEELELIHKKMQLVNINLDFNYIPACSSDLLSLKNIDYGMKFFTKSNFLNGKNGTYYYQFQENENAFNIDKEKVISFIDYKKMRKKI